MPMGDPVSGASYRGGDCGAGGPASTRWCSATSAPGKPARHCCQAITHHPGWDCVAHARGAAAGEWGESPMRRAYAGVERNRPGPPAARYRDEG